LSYGRIAPKAHFAFKLRHKTGYRILPLSAVAKYASKPTTALPCVDGSADSCDLRRDPNYSENIASILELILLRSVSCSPASASRVSMIFFRIISCRTNS